MANEKDLKIRVPVSPELDKRAVSRLRKDLSGLTKDLSKLGFDYKNLAKISQLNVKGLQDISTQAKALGNNLSKAAKQSYEDLGKTSKRIAAAERKQMKFAKASAAAGSAGDSSAQAEADEGFERMNRTINSLTKSLERNKKTVIKHDAETRRAIKTQHANLRRIQSSADFSGGDAMKGILKGLGKAVAGGKSGWRAGADEARGAATKGVGGAVSRGTMAGGDVGAMAAMGKAMGALAGVGASFGIFVQMLMTASNHMTKLNKTLIAGTGLANDFAMTGAQYTNTVNNLRQAAMDSHGSLLKFGVDSEAALEAVNAFAKGATGSLGKTEAMLKDMGGNDLTAGMTKFVTNAKLYGSHLGIETTEVAKMMGDMVSDIGYTGNEAMKNMESLVKTASTSGMPVQKFMGVFGQVLPNIDMFTNRIEELTGTIKLLSKSMSAGDVKNFMDSMGKGFDEMDFKQRMKMAFIIGPKKVANILQKDFKNSGDAIAKNFKNGFGDLGGDVKNALQSADPVKAMAEVVSKASAMGVTPAAIGDAQKLARNMASLKKGNVLDTATAMRGAGMYARMKMMKEMAGKFTGGNVSGLGEHVAKSVGQSEPEYKAMLSLMDNMAMHQAGLAKIGKTSSKSMNANLMKIWKQNKLEQKGGKEDLEAMEKSGKTQENFAQDMKTMATKNPKEMEDAIMQAASMNVDGLDTQQATMEDLATDQYNIQTSISDKLSNIIGYWLEKVFYVLQPILDVLNSAFDWFTSDDDKKGQIIAEKKKLDLQRKSASNISKTMMAGSTDKNKDAMSGMTQIIKDAADTKIGKKLVKNTTGSRAGSHYEADPKGMMTKLAPILERAGDISTKAFDAQSKARGGNFFKGDTKGSQGFRALLSKAEEAKKNKDPVGEKKAREEAKKYARDFLTNQIKTGHAAEAITQAGHIGSAVVGSGIKIAGAGDPNATHTAHQNKSNEIENANQAKLDADVEKNHIRDMDAADAAKAATAAKRKGKGRKGAAAAAPAAAPAVAPAPRAAHLFPLEGQAVGGPSAAKSDEAAAKSADISTAVAEHVGIAEEQLSTGENQDQTMSQILAELKSGITIKDISSGLKSTLNKIVLDNVATALFDYALITDAIKAEDQWALKKGVTSLGASKELAYKAKKDILGPPKWGGGYTGDGPTMQPAGVVHRGEFVIPKGGALVSGGGSKGVNVGTVNIHIQTNDPHEIKRVVDDIFNQGH
jgi:hypothetical protein